MREASPKTWKRKAMKEWGEIIHALFPDCAMREATPESPCAGPMQAHHLVSRSRPDLALDPRNGVRLCASHHMGSRFLSAHKAPLQFARYLQELYPKQWEWALSVRSRQKLDKIDYEVKYHELKAMLETIRKEGAEAVTAMIWYGVTRTQQ